MDHEVPARDRESRGHAEAVRLQWLAASLGIREEGERTRLSEWVAWMTMRDGGSLDHGET